MKLKSKLALEALLENIKEDHISESSAQCAYYVILSFIPFIILLLTLIQYTNADSQQLFEIISNVVPDSMNEMVLGIVREVYSKSIGTVSISLIFTLFSADKGLFALTKELHLIYNYSGNKEKSFLYLKIMSIIQTIVFIMIITFGLVAMVFRNTIISTVKENSEFLENYNFNSEMGTRIVFIVVAFIMFLIIYRFMSGHKVKIRYQIIGAMFASASINVISFVFSRYLEIFKGFSTTYGSLTTLMLIMMWTYSCFYVLFLGAEINKIYNTKNDIITT